MVDDAPMASMFGLAPRSIPTPRTETADVVKLSRARGKKRRRKLRSPRGRDASGAGAVARVRSGAPAIADPRPTPPCTGRGRSRLEPHERPRPTPRPSCSPRRSSTSTSPPIDARPVIDAMRKMSFTSRDTARAADIFNMAIEDTACSPWLILAGSTSRRRLHARLSRHGAVRDDRRGGRHRRLDRRHGFLRGARLQALSGARSDVDDRELRALYIDRIYDTYIDEEELQNCDHAIHGDRRRAGAARPIPRREFIHEMGKWLAAGNAKKPGSLIQTAYRGRRADLLPGLRRFLGRLRPGQAPGGARSRPGKPYVTHRRGRRLPRADRHQDRRRHHRPVHGRRRRAEELRPGHRGLRRDPRRSRPRCTNTPCRSPSPTCATAPARPRR